MQSVIVGSLFVQSTPFFQREIIHDKSTPLPYPSEIFHSEDPDKPNPDVNNPIGPYAEQIVYVINKNGTLPPYPFAFLHDQQGRHWNVLMSEDGKGIGFELPPDTKP